MKSFFSVLFLTVTISLSAQTQYGALIGAPVSQRPSVFQTAIAKALGITCMRERTFVLYGQKASPHYCNTDFHTLLNFCGENTRRINGALLPFRTDTILYKADLLAALEGVKGTIAIAVIENEEANKTYYSGTAKEYIAQLTAAIGVMHSKGIQVANGGITYIGLNYLTYLDFLKQGKNDSAALFQKWANVIPKSKNTQGRGAFVDTLLDAYQSLPLDYVNFHWKASSDDARGLQCVINYLRKRTGKSIISNELGQWDTNPQTVMSTIEMCTDNHLAYCVWYSPDATAGKRDTPLQNPNGTLTPSGVALKIFLKNIAHNAAVKYNGLPDLGLHYSR